jgi:ankyrin repeat protein
MKAATGTKPEVVPLLVRAGCPLEAVRDDDGETALMIAAGGDASVTRALLAAGANVHARDKEGATPLIHALYGAIHYGTVTSSPEKWNPAIVHMLIDAGADPCVRDASGAILWSLAARSGRHRQGSKRVLSAYAARCR